MIITKSLANKVSGLMVAKKLEEITEMKNNLWGFTKIHYDRNIPDLVHEAYKLHSNFFETKNTMRVNGDGFINREISTVNGIWVIVPYHGGGNLVTLTGKTSSDFLKMYQKIEKAESDRKKLRDETERALVNLRTLKKVESSFPEAVQYITPNVKKEIATTIDLTKLRNNFK